MRVQGAFRRMVCSARRPADWPRPPPEPRSARYPAPRPARRALWMRANYPARARFPALVTARRLGGRRRASRSGRQAAGVPGAPVWRAGTRTAGRHDARVPVTASPKAARPQGAADQPNARPPRGRGVEARRQADEAQAGPDSRRSERHQRSLALSARECFCLSTGFLQNLASDLLVYVLHSARVGSSERTNGGFHEPASDDSRTADFHRRLQGCLSRSARRGSAERVAGTRTRAPAKRCARPTSA